MASNNAVAAQGELPTSSPTAPSAASPSLFGMPLKYVSLVTLAVQNALLTIIMHYSRVSTPPGQSYSAAVAVLLNELLKGSISFCIAFSNLDAARASDYRPVGVFANGSSSAYPYSVAQRLRKLSREILSADCWKLSIPAILYVIQNNLQYVAASNLDIATFQVTYQMKILTTAAFSVVLLRKRLTATKWLALLGLALGVGVVQIQATANSSGGHSNAASSAMNPTQGFLAVSAACFTSGLAGVYFEMVLKGSQADLWVRNVQLSLFSLVPAIFPIVFDGSSSLPDSSLLGSLFQNFGFWAWATVCIQVFGGLVTAVVIKYSDNILKGFATSLSIIISFLASVALFNFSITPGFVVGATVVLGATWLYNQPAPKDSGQRQPFPGSPIKANAPIIGDYSQNRRRSSLRTILGNFLSPVDAVPPAEKDRQLNAGSAP